VKPDLPELEGVESCKVLLFTCVALCTMVLPYTCAVSLRAVTLSYTRTIALLPVPDVPALRRFNPEHQPIHPSMNLTLARPSRRGDDVIRRIKHHV
jgi:hypothetical protein